MSASSVARHSLSNVIDSMTETELDLLPHGAIQLSTDGRVLKFNAYESTLSNLKKENVSARISSRKLRPVPTCRSFTESFGPVSPRKTCILIFDIILRSSSIRAT